MRVATVIPFCEEHRDYAFRAAESVDAAYREEQGVATSHCTIVQEDPGGMGPGWTRNRGMEKAAEIGADWVLFLDADDVALPGVFSALGEVGDEKALWGTPCLDNGGRLFCTPYPTTWEKIVREGFWNGKGIGVGHFMSLPEALEIGWPEELYTGEDLEFFATFTACHPWRKLDYPLVRVNMGLGGTTAKGPCPRGATFWRFIRDFWERRGREPLSAEEKKRRREEGVIEFYGFPERTRQKIEKFIFPKSNT